MGVIREEPGTVLVIAEKQEACTFVKSAISSFVRKIEWVPGMPEAKKKIASERILLLVIFLPLSDGGGIDDAVEVADRKSIPSVILVGTEIYPQTVYRARGRRIYVLAYPAKKSILAQTVNILFNSQVQLYQLIRERDALQEKLADLSVINRAKLVLVEKKGLTEDEAHHQVEHVAMDRGITKRKAAEYLLRLME